MLNTSISSLQLPSSAISYAKQVDSIKFSRMCRKACYCNPSTFNWEIVLSDMQASREDSLAFLQVFEGLMPHIEYPLHYIHE